MISANGGATDPSQLNHPFLDESGKSVLNVLLLEDNDIDAAVFEAAASQCSRKLRVTRISTVAAFREALNVGAPHLICSDHLLPDGSALEAIREAATRFPETPILVITGAGEEDVAVDYLKAGAADYLSKRRLHVLPTALDEVIDKFKLQILHNWSETERVRLNGELLALIRRVEEERDNEKRSLSRDIHDQLGQELTALKLGLFWIQGNLRKATGPDGTDCPLEPSIEKIDQLVELNTSIINQVRNIAHTLRPVVLDQVGLTAGVEFLVQEFNKRERTFCGVHCDPLPDLSEGLRTDIFRIVQEALTNISRHAEANLAYVRLKVDGDELLLEIGDDGKGMALNPDPKGRMGLGMVGIRERIRNHGGRFQVESQQGRGTSMSVCFSLSGGT